MKKIFLGFVMLMASFNSFSQIEGTWKIAPQAGALGVGPTQGNISWWSNSVADLTTRVCFFDDKFVFNGDGTFQNVMDGESWIEGWQGGTDACGTPVYPHDGSNPATWFYDPFEGTLTVTGVGAHLGIPKAANGFELSSPSQAPEAITYIVFDISATSMTIDINVGGGWWRFIMEKQPEAGSDATLSDLEVDGTTIPGFLSSVTDYTYGLPVGTIEIPQITTATPTDSEVLSIEITQASTIPGTATVFVTAADGIATMTYSVFFAIEEPTTAPAIPPHAQEDVISIYSDTYLNLEGTNFNPWWWQQTVVTVDEVIAGNNTLKYENLNYQGTEYTNQDVSAYEFLHVDFWTISTTPLKFFLISPGNETDYTLPSTIGQWESVDIPLDAYLPPVDLTNVFQFKVEGSGTVWFDNFYFWKSAGSVVLTFDPNNGATNVPIDINPTLSFSLPVEMADGTTISNSDIPSLITFKKTDASGADVPFTGSINPEQDIITVNPVSGLEIFQTYYLALNHEVIKSQGGDLIAQQSITFTTESVPLTLPVTFEDNQVNYGLTDFGGTISNITADPSNPFKKVVETIKSEGSETWAGTTVGEPTGLIPAVPFEEGLTTMSMRVLSPEAGIPIIFKLEVWDDISITVETTSITTVANEWETLYFDFSNENPETPPLDFENAYNKPVVFFNYGTAGSDEVYYWDDIEFINIRKMDLTVFLEGPFNATDMSTALNPSYLPLNQPFNTEPWNYSGIESVTSIPSGDVVDWILVEFRDAESAELATSETMVAQQAAFLLKDGSVVGLDGTSFLNFDILINQGLFVAIWHRNHLQVLSSSEVVAINGIYTYDFSVGQGQAMNGNIKEIGVGIWGMYGGNGYVDEHIDDNDMETWNSEAGNAGYFQGDFNMDGQLDNLDKNDNWLLNNGTLTDEYQLIWQDEFEIDGTPDEDK